MESSNTATSQQINAPTTAPMFKPTTGNTFAGQAVVGNDASSQPNTQAQTDDEADTGTQAFKDQLAVLQKELELE